jgi:hypothetical protein
MRDDEGIPITSKADQYLYAILALDGTCWVVRDGAREEAEGLPSLMREGWRPIRETPFMPGPPSGIAIHGYEFILICLERT